MLLLCISEILPLLIDIVIGLGSFFISIFLLSFIISFCVSTFSIFITCSSFSNKFLFTSDLIISFSLVTLHKIEQPIIIFYKFIVEYYRSK